ncbi:MAG: cupredoxin domain-containing protein [Actinomycetota bacterium]
MEKESRDAQVAPEGTRRVWRRVLAIGIALVLVVAMSAVALAAVQKVKAVDGNKFKPKHAYIERLDKIKWVNKDNITHNVKSTNLKKNWKYGPKTIKPGESVSRKFKKLGTYIYRCTLHSAIVSGVCEGMCGFVHVQKKT